MNFGEKLKQLRMNKGMTQRELADAVSTSFSTYRRWETEGHSPALPILSRLAAALNTTVAYLSGETDVPDRGAAKVSSSEIPNSSPALPQSNVRSIPGPYVMVPVLGPESLICCGAGFDLTGVIPEVEWQEPIPEAWLTGPKGEKPYYITHVEGDSMEPLIQNGERILINPNEEVKHGDVAVAVWNDRTVIRGVKFERNGDVRLIPVNRNYHEDIVSAEDAPYTLDFKGVVIRFLGVDRISHGIL